MRWTTQANCSTFNASLTIDIDRTSRLCFNIRMVEKALFIALVALALVVGVSTVGDAVKVSFETTAVALDSANHGPTRTWED